MKHRSLLLLLASLSLAACTSEGAPMDGPLANDAGPEEVPHDDADTEADADAGEDADAGSELPDGGASMPQTDLTYWKDMRPLFEAHCLPCHQEGGRGPFSLLHYTNAHAFRFVIRSATRVRTMPPCEGEPEGECGLSDDEIARIGEWVLGDAPEGEAPEP